MRRIPALDILRGFAILLMIFDHCAFFSAAGVWWRLPGRFAMPLFMLVSGYLWHGFNRRRLLQVGLAAVLSTLLTAPFHFPFPDILGVWLLCQPLMPFVDRWPVAAAVLGFGTSQLIIFWTGYQPGIVILWLAIGRLLRSLDFSLPDLPARMTSAFRWLGQYPLSVYVGHLAILSILFWR